MAPPRGFLLPAVDEWTPSTPGLSAVRRDDAAGVVTRYEYAGDVCVATHSATEGRSAIPDGNGNLTVLHTKGRREKEKRAHYRGSWSRGCMRRGTCVWSDGAQYSGMWSENVMHGAGRMSIGMQLMEGMWKKGELVREMPFTDAMLEDTNFQFLAEDYVAPVGTEKGVIHQAVIVRNVRYVRGYIRKGLPTLLPAGSEPMLPLLWSRPWDGRATTILKLLLGYDPAALPTVTKPAGEVAGLLRAINILYAKEEQGYLVVCVRDMLRNQDESTLYKLRKLVSESAYPSTPGEGTLPMRILRQFAKMYGAEVPDSSGRTPICHAVACNGGIEALAALGVPPAVRIVVSEQPQHPSVCLRSAVAALQRTQNVNISGHGPFKPLWPKFLRTPEDNVALRGATMAVKPLNVSVRPLPVDELHQFDAWPPPPQGDVLTCSVCKDRAGGPAPVYQPVMMPCGCIVCARCALPGCKGDHAFECMVKTGARPEVCERFSTRVEFESVRSAVAETFASVRSHYVAQGIWRSKEDQVHVLMKGDHIVDQCEYEFSASDAEELFVYVAMLRGNFEGITLMLRRRELPDEELADLKEDLAWGGATRQVAFSSHPLFLVSWTAIKWSMLAVNDGTELSKRFELSVRPPAPPSRTPPASFNRYGLPPDPKRLQLLYSRLLRELKGMHGAGAGSRAPTYHYPNHRETTGTGTAEPQQPGKEKQQHQGLLTWFDSILPAQLLWARLGPPHRLQIHAEDSSRREVTCVLTYSPATDLIHCRTLLAKLAGSEAERLLALRAAFKTWDLDKQTPDSGYLPDCCLAMQGECLYLQTVFRLATIQMTRIADAIHHFVHVAGTFEHLGRAGARTRNAEKAAEWKAAELQRQQGAPSAAGPAAAADVQQTGRVEEAQKEAILPGAALMDRQHDDFARAMLSAKPAPDAVDFTEASFVRRRQTLSWLSTRDAVSLLKLPVGGAFLLTFLIGGGDEPPHVRDVPPGKALYLTEEHLTRQRLLHALRFVEEFIGQGSSVVVKLRGTSSVRWTGGAVEVCMKGAGSWVPVSVVTSWCERVVLLHRTVEVDDQLDVGGVETTGPSWISASPSQPDQGPLLHLRARPVPLRPRVAPWGHTWDTQFMRGAR
eukprot:TRINITY_DN1862_c0_g2_i4.p1 TRINITY_DN1862_c0_g2~~TRINITY_DN1862_c0_g2_i4.p1  ORF type:complete len:1120 (+),score=117.15 TRINITY_DN1862_c0_g2_i4:50-3409(+)